MRPRPWPVVLASLTFLVVLLMTVKQSPPGSANNSVRANKLIGYRIGHDWVEPPADAISEATAARRLLGTQGDAIRLRLNTECSQPNCRTCQWMAQFGGEW